MTPHELRVTLDRLDLSAAEAGHLLGVHRATIYRWLDGSMSVPIVVELLLRLMVRRGIRPAEVTASRLGQTSAKPQSGRSQAKPAKPIVHNTRARSKQAAVLALLSRPRGATIAAMILVNDPGSWSHIYPPLEHAEWNGWTPTDLIFPFFLFIVGVSMTLSMATRIARDVTRGALVIHVVRRSALIAMSWTDA